jgi:hypothetical protein
LRGRGGWENRFICSHFTGIFRKFKFKKEISEEVEKSLITYLATGRQGLWDDYTDEKRENLFSHSLKSV